MHIEEVVVDGFKSYAQRTVIKGFDPHFNAITGLNGSGKSNILDSICFVLGITNLSQVRAGNLSELVYKQGQAGVNKAIVTIVFNNEDESCSPVGYEQCKEVTVTRQVLIGGKSKYLINGRNAPAGQVQNLFHSVQLNVNNPHFLIMQGRITKVLNMKPHEILGMVEEAAGTRMYETKRVAALKTIEKKQAKVDELNSVLSEEITPTLERLRGEKQNYLRWSKNSADIERIERFVVASEYMEAKNALEDNSEGSDGMKQKIKELEQSKDDLKDEIVAVDVEAEKLSARLQGEFEQEHNKAKLEENKLSKELVKMTTSWRSENDDLQKVEEDMKAAQAIVEDNKAAIKAKEKDQSKQAAEIEKQKQEAKAAKKELDELQKKYNEMSAGISSSEGDEGRSLPERISKALSDSKTAAAKAKQANMRISHIQKHLKSVTTDLIKLEKKEVKLTTDQKKMEDVVEDLQRQIEELLFLPTEFHRMEQEKSQLEESVDELSGKIDTLHSQLDGRLKFEFADPVRGFDRSKVKGRVVQLISIGNPEHAQALEIVAGGRLFQVVVDEATTGKALLERSKLKKRVTFIPLDKIRGKVISDEYTRKANNVAKSFKTLSSPAIELVGFAEEVRSAIEYVFGSSFVVVGPQAADQVCKETMTRTVTLEGDVYDPKGTISGGSKPERGSILEKLVELSAAESEHCEKQSALKSVTAKLQSLKEKSTLFENLNTSLDIRKAELESVTKQLSQTQLGVLLQQKKDMGMELESAKKESVDMENESKEKQELHEELKSRQVELTQQREDLLKEILSNIKMAKQEHQNKEQIAREAASRSQASDMELESLKAELHAAEDGVRVAKKQVSATADREQKLQIQVGEAKARYDVSKEKLQAAEKLKAACSKELSALDEQRANKTKAQETASLEIKKLQVAITKIEKERANAEKVVATMLKKHSWIESEQSAFGAKGGDYDFEDTDPKQTSKVLRELTIEQENLSKKINKKVMGMIEKAEGEYTELLRKRKVVENDKKKIQAVIEELDVKKKSELERTWIKVNRDFGSIFTTLLPGASAKLEPPEGMEAWEGLEVKVAFGNVWKESLSELSGGQRSLLALSLILSLLLFKPAPMYILDEVDAALDLSHTQNIGNMLRTHFSQSQFIVVSLKEGMFNNANVIFRTKFVDGVSTVARTIGQGPSKTNAKIGKALNQSQGKSRASRRSAQGAGKENSFL